MAVFFTLCAFATPSTINEAIIKKFNETFPAAQSVKWYESSDYYQVSFTKDDILCKIDYSLTGDIQRTMRYYKEKDLCPFIALQVKNKYKGKSIKGIAEMQNRNGILYEIVMFDDAKWYIVHCDSDGNLTVKNKYKKA